MKTCRGYLTCKRWHGLFVVLVLPWATAVCGDVIEEPRFLRLRASDAYLRLELEDDRESTYNRDTEERFDDRDSWVSPTLGLTLDGSLYHSYLLDFDLSAEIGFRRADKFDDRQRLQGADPNGEESNDIQRYQGAVRFLKEKPYALTLFGNRYIGDRDDDFYNRTKINGERYGATTGYSEGPVPLVVTATHWDETVDDPVRPTAYDEDSLVFQASNQRASGDRTTLEYTLQDFTRLEPPTVVDEGLRHTVDFQDLQTFNTKGKLRLTSYVRYDNLTESPRPSEGLTVREKFTNHHTKQWRSDYDYLLSNRKLLNSKSDSQEGRVSLTHQLYESLLSTFEVDARVTGNESPGSSLDTTRYGGGIGERYSKRLGAWGGLHLDAGVHVHHEDRESAGGTRVVIDEAHTLTDGEVTLLNVPLADPSSIVVTDTSNTLRHRQSFDYTVSQRGAATEIRRVPGGRIPNGSVVLVDYRAEAQPSDAFDSVETKFGARINLYEQLLAVYARVHDIRNYGGESLVIQDLDNIVLGIDSSWRALRAGAEYEDYVSNLSPFEAVRLFESVQVNPTLRSSLGLDLRQTWTTFTDTDVERQLYTFLGRGRIRLTRSLAFSVEGGALIERGEGVGQFDRDLLTVRTRIDYWIGQVVLNAGYEYEDEDFRATLRRRNYSYFSLKRKF